MLNAKARLTDFLRRNCCGQANALPKAEVARRLGLSERLIFDLAQEARDAGYPVVSTCTGVKSGMFYAYRVEEILRAKAELKSRLGAIRRHLDSLEKIEAENFREMPLFAER